MKTAAIIVTYKKPHLLRQCLSGILTQREKPNAIIVIDNSADSATYDLCLETLKTQKCFQKKEQGIIQKGNLNSQKTFYVSKTINDGGAGGFFYGIELAISLGYDYLWLMDDDGIPHKDSLFFLKKNHKQESVSNSLVVDINDKSKLSFWLDSKGSQLNKSKFDSKKIVDNPEPSFFNGTFLNKSIITKFGNIEKKLFIWGDETEFLFRLKSKSVPLFTVVESLHYHPINKKTIILKFPLSICVRKIDNPFFEFLYYRNSIFINYKYYYTLNRRNNFFKSIIESFINIMYHAINFRFDRSKKISQAVCRALQKNLNSKA